MATFGYTTLGTDGELSPDSTTVAAGRFTVPNDCGVIDKISAQLRLEASGTCPVRASIWTNNSGGGNIIGSIIDESAGSTNLSSTTYTLIDITMSTDLTAYQGQDVWLFVWCDSFSSGNVWHVPYDLNATSNTIYISWGNTYPTWGTVGPPNEAFDTANPTIYVTYTPTSSFGTPSLKGLQSISGIQSIKL